MALPEGIIWRDILRDNMLDQHCRRRNWSGQVFAFLAAIGYVGSQGSLEFAPLNLDVVLYM